LSNVDFTHARLHEVNFTGADLTNADLTGADLTDSNITPEQLRQAKSTSGVLLSPGLYLNTPLAALSNN